MVDNPCIDNNPQPVAPSNHVPANTTPQPLIYQPPQVLRHTQQASTSSPVTLSQDTLPPTNVQLTHVRPNQNITDVCTMVHQKEKTFYVLSKFCAPVSDVTDPSVVGCKYLPPKSCMIHCSKVLQDGEPVTNLSPTVYIPTAGTLRKHKYNIVDACIIKCCQPTCSNKLGTQPKQMHFICYMHTLLMQSNEGLQMIELESIK
jgi:hypothetical protein